MTIRAWSLARADKPEPSSPSTQFLSKDSPRVVWLARLGALFLVLELYVLGRWVFSDQFTRARPGPDEGTRMIWIHFWDILSVGGSILFVAWIVRRTLRDRELPAVAIVALAWLLTAWQDPMVNALRPVFSYNSHFYNFGSWGEFIPGWVDNGGVNPQPVAWTIGTYFFFVPVAMIGAAQYLDWWRRRIPRINRAGLIAVLMVLMFAQDVIGEWVTLIQGVDQYMRVPGNFALWPGTSYQFPLYEGLAWGCGMVGLSAMIYYFRDEKGYMYSDFGLDRVKTTDPRKRTLIRVLALGAVFNVAMLVFNLGYLYVNQQAETTPPSIPSYIDNGMCGVADNPPCGR